MKLGKLLKKGINYAAKHPTKAIAVASLILPGAVGKVAAKVAKVKKGVEKL